MFLALYFFMNLIFKQISIPFFLLFFSLIVHAQSKAEFYYTHSKSQVFNFKPKNATFFNWINLNSKEVKTNSLFVIPTDFKRLIIPESGYYEISGSFNFNLNVDNLHYSRAGINFGFIQIQNNREAFVAATRFSFTNENQKTFQNIKIKPTVVYLERNTFLAPAISSGLLDKVLYNSFLGCEPKESDCISFEWKVIKIDLYEN